MLERLNTKKDKVLALGILGATGRMGQALIAATLKDPTFSLSGGCGRADTARIEEVFAKADLVIDVSLPEALDKHLGAALLAKKPLLIGSTGHGEEMRETLQKASAHIPILVAPNFSLGIAYCLRAAELLARGLNCPIEIAETHHVHKKDRPSGTALSLAKACSVDAMLIESRREGAVIGEHLVSFLANGEKIELKHTALSREAFAEGALRAARFLSAHKTGLYEMRDVVGERL